MTTYLCVCRTFFTICSCFKNPELLSLTLLWPRVICHHGSQRGKTRMWRDRETKDSPAAVIGLLFFRHFVKSLGTSFSFCCIPPSSALPFNSLFLSVSLLCAKNIFIILCCCPHSAVAQHTNDRAPVCVGRVRETLIFLFVGVKAWEDLSAMLCTKIYANNTFTSGCI